VTRASSILSLTRTLTRTAGAASLALLAAGPALAAGGADDGHGGEAASHVGELLWQALNLVILIGVLVVFARKPIKAFFADRRKRIGKDLSDAAALLAQAESRYAQWQHKLIDLDAAIARIKKEGRARAEDDRAAIIAEAQTLAERIHRNAVATVEQELRRAQTELRKEAAILAIELAEGILREKLEDGDRDRLLDEFITRVEPGAGSANGR
jgi:F-type H+-transporting ATPase subunit b